MQAEAALMLAALPSLPRSLCYWGYDVLPLAPCLQVLTQLSLHVWNMDNAALRVLAGWLPRLKRFELGHQNSRCDLLSLLPAAELCVQLTVREGHIEPLLLQLASVKLHTLELRLPDSAEFTSDTQLLLARCQVAHLVLHLSKETQCTLQQLPEGAAVVYKRWYPCRVY